MGEFQPNPNVAARIFYARQKNNTPQLNDNLIGSNLMQARSFNFQQPTIDGKRNGIPHGQAIDYFVLQRLQENPYIRGMHPYTSNMMVDIAPSVYNTNPLAGTGGYEHNLASFNGTRPLATALDEPQEIAQRAYEDTFKMSAKNPLSMQFTLNHSDVDKRTRGEMYDAFRLGLDRNNQGPEPDYDTVLQSKVNKGYKDGIIPIGDDQRNPIENYLQNQKPLRTSDFNRGVKRIIDHYTPGPIRQLAAQAGVAANAVAAGAPNLLNLPNMTPIQRQKNNVQIQQVLNGLTPNFDGSAGRNKRTKLNDDFDEETMTPSDPLMKNQKIPVSNRRPFEYEDLPSKKTPPNLEYLDQRRHGSDQWEPFTPGSRFPKKSPSTQPMYGHKNRIRKRTHLSHVI